MDCISGFWMGDNGRLNTNLVWCLEIPWPRPFTLTIWSLAVNRVRGLLWILISRVSVISWWVLPALASWFLLYSWAPKKEWPARPVWLLLTTDGTDPQHLWSWTTQWIKSYKKNYVQALKLSHYSTLAFYLSTCISVVASSESEEFNLFTFTPNCL